MMMLCLVISVAWAAAQTKVAGVVVSSDNGEPVIGASIVVKGTTTGTVTDVNGKFSLAVPQGTKTLVVSYIGMTTKEEMVRPNMRIALVASSQNLNEVMVVAYGTATKKSFTGSVTSISGDKLSKKNSTEVTRSLAGEIAGVQVVSGSGQPGSNATVRIRGIGSVNSSATPLYVVDGMPYYGDISSINPADIESTSVLKDATATALYGSRGANGVILLTTKKGLPNTSKIDVEVKAGISTRLIPLYDVVDSPERYLELAWESARNRRMIVNGESSATAASWVNANLFTNVSSPTLLHSGYNMWNADGDKLIDPTTGKFYAGINRKYTPESWEDNIFRTGHKQEANVKFSGGGDKSTYFTSLGILKDQGYYRSSDFSRVTGRTNIDHKFKSWLKGSSSLAYISSTSNNPVQSDSQNNGFQFVNFIPSIYPVYARDLNGKVVADPKLGGNQYDYGYDYNRGYGWGINPAGALSLDKSKAQSNQVDGNAMLEASFLKDFKFKVELGATHLDIKSTSLTNKYWGDAEDLGRVEKLNSDYLGITSNQMLSYKKAIQDHHFDAFIAHESTNYTYSFEDAQKSMLAAPDKTEFRNAILMDDINSDTYKYAIESYFGQVRYDFDEKYFFNANLRFDGSSRFSKGHRWGTFGSFGAAWLMSSESFMKEWSFIKTLKLKASYGVLGNQDFIQSLTAASYYPTENLYDITNLQGNPALTLAYVGNPNLTWEKSKTFNVGLEFDLLNDKMISGSLEWFNKITDNLLFSKQMPTSVGFATKTFNEGKIRNQGIEFDIKVKAINTNNVKLSVRANASKYTNKFLAMPTDMTTGLPKDMEIHSYYGWAKGHSMYDFYVRDWAGVNPQTGAAQWYAYYDVKNNGTKVNVLDLEAYKKANPNANLVVEKTEDYTQATKKYVNKSVIPKVSGGFGFDLEAYGIEFSSTFVYSLGGYGYDAVYATLMGNHKVGANNWSKDIENRWTTPGQITDVPRLSNNASVDSYENSTSSRFITSTSYLHLSNVRLGYNLPKKWLNRLSISKVNIYASAENLFVVSARKGYVPINDFTGLSDRSAYAPLSTIVGGLSISF